VNLFDGERGPDAVATMRSAIGDIPVIFITATAADRVDCDYATDILEKPIQPERVMATIAAVGRCRAGAARFNPAPGQTARI